MLPLSATMVQLRMSWWWTRHLRSPVLALIFGTILALVIGELALRALPPRTIDARIGNIMFSCYQPEFPERNIYAHVLAIDQTVHRPNLQTECYFNGHFWQHRSDAYGWRNPETWSQVDVVLLGDSMIYGHGVEENQTVAHFLRRDLGVKVANQAMMGNCPMDYLAIYRNFSLPLAPKVTVMFIFVNDMSDLSGLDQERLDRFAETGELPQARRYRRDDLLNTLTYPEVSTLQRLAGQSRLYSVLRYYVPALRATPIDPVDPGSFADLPSADPAAALAEMDYRGDPNAWFGRELGFTRRVIATMARSAKAHNTGLVVAYLPGQYDDTKELDVRMPIHLARFARESDVLFFWAGGAISNTEGTGPRKGTRLPHDGHLSELGHRLLAKELARFLERHLPAVNRRQPL